MAARDAKPPTLEDVLAGRVPGVCPDKAVRRRKFLETVGREQISPTFTVRNDSVLAGKFAAEIDIGMSPLEVAHELHAVSTLYNHPEYKNLMATSFEASAHAMRHSIGCSWSSAYAILKDWQTSVVRAEALRRGWHRCAGAAAAGETL